MEKTDACSILELPAGFRFCPTDEEIIIHYLLNKVLDKHFGALAIGEADLNKTEPWDLPEMAKTGEKEWFFFWQRYRKYPTGMRTNRATESGYWKATGKDKNIYKPRKCLVGMKKTLVFYQGRAPKGHRTNWVMHEYRLEGDHFSNYDISRAAKEEWVVCRVFHKNTIIKPSPGVDEEPARMDPLLNSPTLPSLRDYDQEDEFKPNISSSVSMMLENNKLQKTPHDQINLPLPYQSPNVDPNPGYSIVSRFDGEYFTESTKTFHEQLDDEGLYFDSLWSYWETDCM